ncbi:HAD hydrolase family protein [Aeromonas caviae]|uniref:HAD family hydrolase n=1 Tax=Aeromonas caviae TaxID=648 RepID=UPI00191DDB4E|nr:HAD hydrolase family protein [Aeromonas caviae]MBL0498090.1 HAD hydrolase family protein [Aeromonas caviae]
MDRVEALLGNALGLAIIRRLERLPGEHIVIACTAIREEVPDHLKALVRRSYTQVQTVADFGDITADVVKITVYDEQGRCLELRGQHDEFDDEACIVASDKQWIDIANAGVHKGTTVARLQQLVGAGRHETLVFGDELNDIELMACADFSFTMRNGHDETKDAAHFITRSNDEDAVMHTILQLLALQRQGA